MARGVQLRNRNVSKHLNSRVRFEKDPVSPSRYTCLVSRVVCVCPLVKLIGGAKVQKTFCKSGESLLSLSRTA